MPDGEQQALRARADDAARSEADPPRTWVVRLAPWYPVVGAPPIQPHQH